MVYVSVVVPTCNRKRFLKKCITTLLSQTFGDYEVIIVDDGSTDGTPDLVKKFDVRYLRQKRNGPASARNTGIRLARGKIIAFTDDDCDIDKNWLKNLVLEFKNNKEYHAVKGNTKTKIGGNNSLAYYLQKHVYVSKGSSATNNIAYKKKALEAVNYFDEYFPLPAYEDCDLLMRFKLKGFKIKYCDNAVVYHPREKSIDEFKQRHYISGLGMSYFFKKYLAIDPKISVVVIYQTFLELVYLPKLMFTRLTNKKYYFTKEYFKIVKSMNVIRGLFVGLFTNPKRMSKPV